MLLAGNMTAASAENTIGMNVWRHRTSLRIEQAIFLLHLFFPSSHLQTCKQQRHKNRNHQGFHLKAKFLFYFYF
jgi:hypothetical protein